MVLINSKIPTPVVYTLPLTAKERVKLHRQRKLRETELHSLAHPVEMWVTQDARDLPLTDSQLIMCHIAYLQTWIAKKEISSERQFKKRLALVQPLINNLCLKGYSVKLKP